MSEQDFLKIADKSFPSRLMIGTGKYPSNDVMIKSIEASGASIVTVALRRVDLENPDYDILTPLLDKDILILPNTSGAIDADEAIRLARLSKASGISNWVKLEITPDPKYLMPDGEETLKAARILVKEGFIVLPYINADPILAKKLEEEGCATVMPLASPIGSNKGLMTLDAIKMIIDQSNIPVVVDAGIGKPSDASLAMEIGVDAIMLNTAIASSNDPVNMATAFKLATKAGRLAYLSGTGSKSNTANPSSPLDWLSK
jgi:thiazole synthase